jgi:hypothetical protein
MYIALQYKLLLITAQSQTATYPSANKLGDQLKIVAIN